MNNESKNRKEKETLTTNDNPIQGRADDGLSLGIDLHIHTTFSPDSQVIPERACRAAVARDLKTIGFSDHAEFVNEDEAFVVDRYKGSEILEEIERLRALYGAKLEILYGVEVGFIPGMERDIEDFLNSHPFDYAIGSVHYVEGTLVSRWVREVEENGRSFAPYYEALLGATESGLFQILGHLDYVRKYMYAPRNYQRGKYAELIENIISRAARHALVIELNSSGWRHATEEPFPGEDILRRFASLDGMVTYGSDAHKYYEVGYAEKRAGELIRRVGFDAVELFRRRKRSSIPI